jgi:SAM-dependent methyltransferase
MAPHGPGGLEMPVETTSPKQKAQSVWDEIFRDRAKARRTGGWYFYQLALERIRPSETIGDAGCGLTFYLPDLMARCGPGGSFIGIDFSAVALAQSRALAADFPRAHLIRADMRRLPLADNSVDRIFCGETLPYLLDDVEEALTELARVTRKEVIFSLHTRGAYEIQGTETEFRGNIVIEHKPGAKPPRRIFGEEEILSLVENTGGLQLAGMQPLTWGELYPAADDGQWPWYLPDKTRIALYYIAAAKTNPPAPAPAI